MAWTAPRTWVSGEPVTSSLFNTHIRDLFRFMSDEPHECWVERTSDATITTATETLVTWQQATRNVGTMWKSSAAQNVDIKQAGLYAITMNAQWVALSANETYCGIFIPDVGDLDIEIQAGNGDDGKGVNNATQQRSCHMVRHLTVGQRVNGLVEHNQGSNATLQGGVLPGTHLKVVQVQRRLA